MVPVHDLSYWFLYHQVRIWMFISILKHFQKLFLFMWGQHLATLVNHFWSIRLICTSMFEVSIWLLISNIPVHGVIPLTLCVYKRSVILILCTHIAHGRRKLSIVIVYFAIIIISITCIIIINFCFTTESNVVFFWSIYISVIVQSILAQVTYHICHLYYSN